MNNPPEPDDRPAPTPAPQIPEPAHLGDGVYVSFDGYQIWLAANHHTNKVIALEPAVFRALEAWAARLRQCGWSG